MGITIDRVAQACHEMNRIWCEAHGDLSQPHWEDAPDWQKQSARVGVMSFLEDPTISPAETHKNWLKHKLNDGWVYGEVKDEVAKTHPCIKNYEDLPMEQRRKDILFIRTCQMMTVVGPVDRG